MFEDVSKNAKKLLVELYSVMKKRTEDNLPYSEVMFFGPAGTLIPLLKKPSDYPDINACLCELDRAGYICCEYGDDEVSQFYITEYTVATMDHVPDDRAKTVFEVLGTLLNLLP